MFIIDLIERKIAEKFSVNDIKKILYEEYIKYLNEFDNQIIDILILEGKKKLGDQVKSGILQFVDFITTDNYFLTTFDVLLLIKKFEIPTIFISTTKLLETNNKSHFFIGYGKENDEFAFIVVPGISPENVPVFKLIETNTNDVFISLDKLIECEYKTEISEVLKNETVIIIDEFLREFNPKKLGKKKLIVEEDSENENEEPVKKPKRQPKKQLIIESSSSVSPEEFVIVKKNKTKKTKLVGIKPKTKKNK